MAGYMLFTVHRSRSCSLNPSRCVLRYLELLSRGAHRLGNASLSDQCLRHPIAQVVAGPLGYDSTSHQARRGAHSTGQISQAEAQSASVELRFDGAAEKGIHLPQPVVLAPRITEV